MPQFSLHGFLACARRVTNQGPKPCQTHRTKLSSRSQQVRSIRGLLVPSAAGHEPEPEFGLVQLGRRVSGVT